MIYQMDAAANGATCLNTSQVVKLIMHLLHDPLAFQPLHNVISMPHKSYATRQDKFVARQKLLSYLVFQLVARHCLNACDISTLACNKHELSKYDVKIIFSLLYFEHS